MPLAVMAEENHQQKRREKHKATIITRATTQKYKIK